MRVAALVLLLAAPSALSGCLGAEEEGPRLAQPTDVLVIPSATPPPRGPVFNTTDPGYVVTAPWRVGDGWDYESNQSRIRQVRVIDQRLVDGSTKYVLETKQLTSEGVLQSTTRSWVEARTWLLLNETVQGGSTDTYSPGHPMRFWKNGTTTYEHARLDAGGAIVATDQVRLDARLFPRHETLFMPRGYYVEAMRVEQLLTVRSPEGTRTQTMLTYWVHADYLNAVQFQLSNGELYKLTAAKAGDFRRGQLAS